MISLARILFALAILAAAGRASADLPAFTPNVVDPQRYLGDDERKVLDDVIRELRRADIWAAVYLTDRLGDETIETLAERAFRAWKLGEQGKDNGLLLLLAMEDRKMRFETGYGLEGQLTDAICRRALDEYLRPKLREHRIVDGASDALYALARVKDPSFGIAGRAAPSAPQGFDTRAGAVVWIAWVLFIGWLTLVRGKFTFNSRVVTLLFFSLNPGAFLFIGAALLSAHREVVVPVVGTFVLSHLVLVPFYALIVLSITHPVRRYVLLAREREAALHAESPGLLELEAHMRRVTGVGAPMTDGRTLSIFLALLACVAVLVLGLVLGIDYRAPAAFLVPLGLFILTMHLTGTYMRDRASVASFTLYLEGCIRRHTERMERLVASGDATRNDDGTYAYTAQYIARTSSSGSGSSSRSSSGSSSSGGGSSGGGGASSSW